MNGVPTASRHNIQLTEDTLGVGYFRDRPVWRATLDGPLSTGESARVARSGTTAAAALAHLEEAIAEQGWFLVQPVSEARTTDHTNGSL